MVLLDKKLLRSIYPDYLTTRIISIAIRNITKIELNVFDNLINLRELYLGYGDSYNIKFLATVVIILNG